MVPLALRGALLHATVSALSPRATAPCSAHHLIHASPAVALHAPASLTWGLGGRSLDRLAALREELLPLNPALASLPLLVGEGATASAVARAARAVVTTAGPFLTHGEPMLAACVAEGTHYADITGETAWVAAMEAKYGAAAKAKGVLVVPMCGLDSMPSDLGALFAVRAARAALGARASVTSLVTYTILRGGVSGGTIASGRAMAARPELAAASRSPLLLAPPGAPVTPLPDSCWPTWVPAAGQWATHGIMAALNTRVVRRSAGLWAAAGSPYAAPGARFAHGEYALARGWWGALAAKLAGLVLGALLFRPWFFPLVAGSLPKPGQGPSDAAIAKNWFVYLVCATCAGGERFWARVAGGDPGYGETAKMLAEAGVLLAGAGPGGAGLPAAGFGGGGFLTPATAFGEVLSTRLHETGLTFHVVPEAAVAAAAKRGWQPPAA